MIIRATESRISPDGKSWTTLSRIAIFTAKTRKGGSRANVHYTVTKENDTPFQIIWAINDSSGGEMYLQYRGKDGAWYNFVNCICVNAWPLNGELGKFKIAYSTIQKLAR